MRPNEYLGAGIILFAYVALLFISSYEASAVGGLNCTISSTCPSGFTRYLGLENETGGFQNAHTQNLSFSTYSYSLCCNSTIEGVTLGTTCAGGETILRLSNHTNAHAQQEQVNTYPAPICMSASIGTPQCSYPTSCSGGQECLVSMENSEGSNTTNAHLGNCSKYTTKLCCSFNNTAPTNVTLIAPINDTQITNRTPLFNWSQATDPDGDSITYRLQVALESSFSTIVIDQETSNTNFTPASELDFDQFFWRVYSNDTQDWNISTTENFTVITSIILTLVNNSINFSTLQPNQQNATDDDSPPPLLLRNDGNAEANVSINGTILFSSAALGTSNYQYKVDNASVETGSFESDTSTTSYANMPASQTVFMRVFNHTDTNDTAEIDIQITVPDDEPVGLKNSTIEVTGEVS